MDGIGDWLRSEAEVPVPNSGREERGMGTGTSKTRSQSPFLLFPDRLQGTIPADPQTWTLNRAHSA